MEIQLKYTWQYIAIFILQSFKMSLNNYSYFCCFPRTFKSNPGEP